MTLPIAIAVGTACFIAGAVIAVIVIGVWFVRTYLNHSRF